MMSEWAISSFLVKTEQWSEDSEPLFSLFARKGIKEGEREKRCHIKGDSADAYKSDGASCCW